MIQKIINNLKKPHLIPKKLLKKIKYYSLKKKYNFSYYEKKQNKLFSELGLKREAGILKLQELKKNYKFLNRGMSSEHEVILSSLSSLTHKKINNILEIGTFDGINSFLLSLLFKKSNITTIDLKNNSDAFKTSYKRNIELENFLENRNKILSKNQNINFKELNSLNLINHKDTYDLIWIDGAHGYPFVCIDIINSLKLINKDGIIMCDDVYIDKPENQDTMYNSIASFETLKELEKENIIKLNLLYKRLDADNNANSNYRKFVAIFNKVNK